MKYYIHTSGGGKFFYGDEEADVTIEDIAHHLSHVNRFSGATRFPYSVAQHSCLVEELVSIYDDRVESRIAGLIHDAHEYVMGDLPTPFQHWVNHAYGRGEDIIGEAKIALDAQILPKIGVPYPFSEDVSQMVHRCDKMAFLIEASQLFSSKPDWLEEYSARFNVPILRKKISFMDAVEARALFMNRWNTLNDARNKAAA